MKMKRMSVVAVLVLVGALQSCSKIPQEAAWSRGQPESLLSVNTESVSIDLGQRNALATLVNNLNNSDVSRAVVTCSNTLVCSRAETLLNSYNIPYDVQTGATNSVAIISDNISARDCDNRFISNHNNPYNLNHTTFGCSIAMNQVMAVRDKRQFTDPLVLGPYDGFKGSQNYDSYLSREVDDRVIKAQRDSVADGTSRGTR
jgi:type IV pilus biogenesis protein CpaD/CtpE